MTDLRFDDRRQASLDGAWEFFPGDHGIDDLDGLDASSISVPGLWEAQGYLDLDGVAWYRRRFDLADVSGWWSLCFGGVMDLAEVFVNGRSVGSHEQSFTPFELDCTAALAPGANDLAVRVVDPPLEDPEHRRMAHGKQGWANHVFPSRPSLYMTYGGIWQPVKLRRHGPSTLHDVFVEADPDDLVMSARVVNRGPAGTVRVDFRTLGMMETTEVAVAEGGETTVRVRFGPTGAARWTPDAPCLHDVSVDCWRGPVLSDSSMTRFGLRTVRLEGNRMLVGDVPYRMKSVLVQGFGAEELYAEPDDAAIRAEVEAAQAMGFNTLRLHIKAFDPRYLDACDELGMMLHCDIPVAEPIAHEEMGPGTVLVRRCVAAAREQVRRDRNHPSIVLWSAMNEIGDGRPEARGWPAYESFARTLYGAVRDEDPTRPVIENDWVEPDPERVFESPILTAHWYGRLHQDYLDKIETATACWAGSDRPLLVTEFGDWGLPEMPLLADPPFWDTRSVYAAALADTLWPASVSRFAVETQLYQGLSDRLQGEVFRRHDGVGGYCLTELTDVPFELNGVLDLRRRPKRLAVAEVARLNQVVLPMLRLPSLVAAAGDIVHAELHVANDGPELADVTVEGRFGDSVGAVSIDELLSVEGGGLPLEQIEGRFRETAFERFLGDLPDHRAGAHGPVSIVAPDVPGNHDLILELRAGGRLVAENRYPVHVVGPGRAAVSVRALGAGDGREALAALGATVGDAGPTVVLEDCLDAAIGTRTRALLDAGQVVLVLAQEPSAAPHFPVSTAMEPLATVWGSTVFGFTTDHGAIPSLPRRNVLLGEDSTVYARNVVAAVDGQPFPETPVVIAYKPVPNALTGTVIGSHPVGAGRLVYCQFRLTAAAAAGDAGARALLADLLLWVGRPRPVQHEVTLKRDDGRSLSAYSWPDDVAR